MTFVIEYIGFYRKHNVYHDRNIGDTIDHKHGILWDKITPTNGSSNNVFDGM